MAMKASTRVVFETFKPNSGSSNHETLQDIFNQFKSFYESVKTRIHQLEATLTNTDLWRQSIEAIFKKKINNPYVWARANAAGISQGKTDFLRVFWAGLIPGHDRITAAKVEKKKFF